MFDTNIIEKMMKYYPSNNDKVDDIYVEDSY